MARPPHRTGVRSDASDERRHGSNDGDGDDEQTHTLDLESLAFPTLSEAQIDALARCVDARCERYGDGDVLVEAGELDARFFVVVSGRLEVLDVSGDEPRHVTFHDPGSFTGDVTHLSGGAAIVRIVARGECVVHTVPPRTLRSVLSKCADAGELILQAFIARRQLLREKGGFTGLRVIGSRYSKDTFRIRDFLARNRVLYTWLDVEGDTAVADLLQRFGVPVAETPIVACGRRLLLRNPTQAQLAEAIGLRRPLHQDTFDLVVVGAGPAGLAAAVYGASEGLSTIVLERLGPGGQAGRSMRIENYLGFPTGITGAELADRAMLQAAKFGAHVSVSRGVASLGFHNGYAMLRLDDGDTLAAKCLLIATGAEYRRLTADGCERFEGAGVYYAATPNEAEVCRGADVVVVGGGNSAGQAVVFLSQHARRVHLVIRGEDLCAGMSSYLAQRIEVTSNVEVLLGTDVRRLDGDRELRRVDVERRRDGEPRSLEVAALFSFIGAVARTEWLPDTIARDKSGFVLTGRAAGTSPLWREARAPFLLETTVPGTFAAGDVRSESVKRVASAVGDGAMAVQFVHEYLSQR